MFLLLVLFLVLYAIFAGSAFSFKSSTNLGFQFKANADLVATGIEVLAIDQRRQSQGDAIAQLLLVSQAHLAGIVYLGAKAGIVIQLVFGANGELGVAGAAGPRQLNANIQFVGCTLEDRSAELLAIIPGKSNDLRFQ